MNPNRLKSFEFQTHVIFYLHWDWNLKVYYIPYVYHILNFINPLTPGIH